MQTHVHALAQQQSRATSAAHISQRKKPLSGALSNQHQRHPRCNLVPTTPALPPSPLGHRHATAPRPYQARPVLLWCLCLCVAHRKKRSRTKEKPRFTRTRTSQLPPLVARSSHQPSTFILRYAPRSTSSSRAPASASASCSLLLQLAAALPSRPRSLAPGTPASVGRLVTTRTRPPHLVSRGRCHV